MLTNLISSNVNGCGLLTPPKYQSGRPTPLDTKGAFKHIAFLGKLSKCMLVGCRLLILRAKLEFNYFGFIHPALNYYSPLV
jgi:hypothetical protein